MAYIGKSPQNGVRNRFVYAATQGQTAFSGSDADSKTLAISDALYTDVYQNGVKLKLTTDWTATATTVTLVNAASADDVIEIVSFDVFGVPDTVSASTGGTFNGAISTTAATITTASNEEDALLVEQSDGTDVGSLRINNGRFILSGKHSSNPVQIQTHDGNEDIEVDPDGFIKMETAGSERLRIDASGNVGIGLTSPQELLHLKDGNIAVGNGTASNNSVVGRIGFSTDSSNSRFIGMESFRGSDAANADLRFHTYGGDGDKGERLCIANDGKVGIGTISPAAKLHVVQGNNSILFTNTFTNVGHTVCHFSNSEGSGAYRIRFDSNDTVVGSIGVGTSSTAFNTSSDYRLKENVDYTWDATTRLKQLKPARFNFIADDTNTLVDGFIAHEVSSIVPEAVTGTKDAMAVETRYTADDVETQGDTPSKNVGDPKTYSSSKIDPQGIDQSKLVPLLVKALQEQQTVIESLTTRIAALESA